MKLTRVLSSDWEAWYLDDTKIIEGHSVMALLLIDAIRAHAGIELDDMSVSDSQLEAIGWSMPDHLQELMKVID